MPAALTIAVLLALSVSIVRIAAVAMRLTGLPENVARFQCISALTGTGFTTDESEMIVNYPIRRRILVTLMILGNLGMVSVAATFIVAFVATAPEAGAITAQILSIAVAIGVILLVMTNKTLDRLMCGLIGSVLQRTTGLGQRRYQRTLQLDNGFCVAEHVYGRTHSRPVGELSLGDFPLTLLAVRGEETHQNEQISDAFVVSPGDSLVCYGSECAHEALASMMARANTATASV